MGKRLKLEDLLPKLQDQVRRQLEADGSTLTKRGRIAVSPKDQRTLDGTVFSSKWEMTVYKLLCQYCGKDRVHRQPVFLLQERTRDDQDVWHRSIRYLADFVVGEPRNSEIEAVKPGQLIIDAKGMRTEAFNQKRKMVAAKYGAAIFAPKSSGELLDILKQHGYDGRNHQTGQP